MPRHCGEDVTAASRSRARGARYPLGRCQAAAPASSSTACRRTSASRRSRSTRSRSARCTRSGAARRPLRRAARRLLLGPARASSSGSSGATASGKSTLLKCMAGIYGTDAGAIEVDGRLVDVHRARRRLQPRPRGARQRRHQRVMLGLSPREAARAVRPRHRVRRARGVRRPQAQELLVRDARPARVLGHDPGRRRRPADRRGARRRRRRVPAEVLRRVLPAAGRGQDDRSSSRTTCARSSASAIARCCSSADVVGSSATPRTWPTTTSR